MSTQCNDCLLSVIVPTYNYGHMLPRALSSVTMQMDERVELIVIDDGSRDDTAQILDAYSREPGHAFSFAYQENAGPAAARNNGVRLARGQYVLFLDADDELMDGAIASIVEAVTVGDGAVEMLLGNYFVCYPDGSGKTVKLVPLSGSPCQRVAAYLLDKHVSICHGASVFRRDLLLQRPYPEHLRQAEDKAVFACFVANAVPVMLDKTLVRIHKHGDSLRHDAELALVSCQYLPEAVFKRLPSECASLRARFVAQQNLSVFRTCYLAGRRKQALKHYCHAWQADWRQAGQWGYVSKLLRLWLGLGPNSTMPK